MAYQKYMQMDLKCSVQDTAIVTPIIVNVKTSEAIATAAKNAPRTYYIGTDGDDNNDGSRENPYATISAIVDDLQPGDTVYYLEGTYNNSTYGQMVDDGSGNMIRDMWKASSDTIIKLNDVHGTAEAPITIAAEPGAHVVLQYDGNGAIVARQSSHIIFNGFDIEGPATTFTKEDAVAAQYTYRIATSKDTDGNPVYEYYERNPYEVLETKISDIIDSYAETIDQSGSGKPLLFNAAAISLPKFTTNIEITNNVIHDSAAHAVSGHGGNDYITVSDNEIYGNNHYTSNGTHALSFKFLHSSDNNDGYKIIITDNHLYDNYNLLISWVTTKVAVKRHVDEGKSIHIQDAWDTEEGSKYDWDHGQILIDGNVIERAGNAGITLNDARGATVTNNVVIDGAYANTLLTLDTIEGSEYFGFFSAQGLEDGAVIAAGGLRITDSLDNHVANNYFGFSEDSAFAVDASDGTVAGTTTFANNLYFGGAGARIRSENDGSGALHDGFIETEGVLISGLQGDDTVVGTHGDDFILGLDGNDFLRGGEGDDVLDGGFGVDWLRGGAGADVLNGYAGADWADYITSSSAVTVNLLTNTATGGDAEGDTFILVERVYGSSHDDHITGDARLNYLRGYHGDDQLFGGAGNDYLQGGLGADALDGGAGANDWAYYVSSAAGLTVNLGDTSLNTGEAIGDTYIGIENIAGSRHDDDISGDAANNFLRGFQGDDVLRGGDGNDFLRGEQGADMHDGGAGNDWAYYVASSAAVTIDLGANTASGGEAAGDSFISIERVFGSRYADSITGDSSANYLRGYFGDDVLSGGGGTDFLQGDSGGDTLDGGAGSDWAYYASATNGLVINLGDASQNTGEAAGDSYISVENVFGSKFDDIITGDAGDNYLRGFSGDDIINGGAGNDTLRGEAGADTFVFETGGGNDIVIDFDAAEDMLDLSGFGFASLAEVQALDMGVFDFILVIDNGAGGDDVLIIENLTYQDIAANIII